MYLAHPPASRHRLSCGLEALTDSASSDALVATVTGSRSTRVQADDADLARNPA
jgi:hypothetical protein